MAFHRLFALHRRHFRDPRREHLFLASLCFFLTFAVTRLCTHRFRGDLRVHALILAGVHVHHLVAGIAFLLAAGYLWIAQPRDAAGFPRLARFTTILYAVGAALTLDEFALWLQLRDVYWQREGRASIDAVVLFGALVSAGLWAGPFVRALGRNVLAPWWRVCIVRPWHALRRTRRSQAAEISTLEPVSETPAS